MLNSLKNASHVLEINVIITVVSDHSLVLLTGSCVPLVAHGPQSDLFGDCVGCVHSGQQRRASRVVASFFNLRRVFWFGFLRPAKPVQLRLVTIVRHIVELCNLHVLISFLLQPIKVHRLLSLWHSLTVAGTHHFHLGLSLGLFPDSVKGSLYFLSEFLLLQGLKLGLVRQGTAHTGHR